MKYTLEVLVMEVDKMQPGEICMYYVCYSRRFRPIQIVLQFFYAVLKNPDVYVCLEDIS